MATFTLRPLNNGIEKSKKNNVLEFCIETEDGKSIEFKDVEIDLSGFGNSIDWTMTEHSMDEFSSEIKDGKLMFTSRSMLSFTERTEFKFSIENIEQKGNTTPSVNIGFILWDADEKMTAHTYIGSTAIIHEKIPTVTNFKLDPSIVKNNEQLELSFKCTGIDYYRITYYNGKGINRKLPDIVNNECEGTLKITSLYGKDTNDEAAFRIIAKSGNIYASEDCVKTVKIFGSGWEKMIPNDDRSGDADTSSVLDLVLNTEDEKMWVFAKNDAGAIHLWKTNDGLKWRPHVVNNEKVNIPKQFVHHPAVHFKERIYFVCGSKLDVGKCSAELNVLDYKNNRPVYTIAVPGNIGARSLHSCVVFNSCIWVIGGVDENGNGLNDIWRFTGTEWISVPVPANFPKRCSFSATVHIHDGRESIWIAGGYDSYEGSVVQDIWAYNLPDPNNAGAPAKWELIQSVNGSTAIPLKITNSWLKATSLTSLRRINGTYTLALISTIREKNGNIGTNLRFLRKGETTPVSEKFVNPYTLMENSSNASPDLAEVLDDKFVFSSLGFNGCIWIMAIGYKTEDSMSYTQLNFTCL
ncbi:MAG: hypothetical protein JWQ38_1493 [Flavipsychrobacter sp.]|nr:hypothetical protein [Flavipsychrobacter sp.]